MKSQKRVKKRDTPVVVESDLRFRKVHTVSMEPGRVPGTPPVGLQATSFEGSLGKFDGFAWFGPGEPFVCLFGLWQ